MDFNIWLHEKREKNGYTIANFAAKAKLTRTYIYELERPGSNPSLSVITKVANGFGIKTWQALKEMGI